MTAPVDVMVEAIGPRFVEHGYGLSVVVFPRSVALIPGRDVTLARALVDAAIAARSLG